MILNFWSLNCCRSLPSNWDYRFTSPGLAKLFNVFYFTCNFTWYTFCDKTVLIFIILIRIWELQGEVIFLKQSDACHLLDSKWEPRAGTQLPSEPQAKETPYNYFVKSKNFPCHAHFTVYRTAEQSHFVSTNKMWCARLWELENKSLLYLPKLHKWSRSRRTFPKESDMVVYSSNPSTREEKAEKDHHLVTLTT